MTLLIFIRLCSTIVLMIALLFSPASSQTVTKTGNASFGDTYYLDNQSFSIYPTVNLPGGPYVDRHTCGPVHFTALIGLPGSVPNHTFNVQLKRDGIDYQSASKKMGALFKAQSIAIDFIPIGFTPGEWTIAWQFSGVGSTGTSSIKLVAPVTGPSYGPVNESISFCNRNSAFLVAVYNNGKCNYRQKPPTGFIYNNAYYRDGTITSSSCPTGTPLGNGYCKIATAPTIGFVHDNSFYFQPFGIPNFVHTPPYPGGVCPSSLANHAVTKDIWGCLFMAAPSGQTPIAVGPEFWLTEKKNGTCTEGNFDGAHCLIGAPPSGATALESAGTWYWTPRYCQ